MNGICQDRAPESRASIDSSKQETKGRESQKWPNISFKGVMYNDTSIRTVLEHLKRQSRISDRAGVGFNFVYIAEKNERLLQHRVTFKHEGEITLEKLVKAICKELKMQYRLDKYAVVIGKKVSAKPIPSEALRNKYEHIKVSNMDFGHCDLKTVIGYVREDIKKGNHKLDVKSAVKEDDPFEARRYSMKLSSLPAVDFLGYLCEMGQLSLKEDSGVILISEKPRVKQDKER